MTSHSCASKTHYVATLLFSLKAHQITCILQLFFPAMSLVTKALHPSAAAPPPPHLSHIRTHCGPGVKEVARPCMTGSEFSFTFASVCAVLFSFFSFSASTWSPRTRCIHMWHNMTHGVMQRSAASCHSEIRITPAVMLRAPRSTKLKLCNTVINC